jgi:hypothetical protein
MLCGEECAGGGDPMACHISPFERRLAVSKRFGTGGLSDPGRPPLQHRRDERIGPESLAARSLW